jgi:hypothetical protein
MYTIRRIELLALQITGVKYKFQLNISVYVVNYPQDNNYLLPIGTDYLMLPIGFVDNPSMRGSLLFAFIIKLDLFPYEISFQWAISEGFASNCRCSIVRKFRRITSR